MSLCSNTRSTSAAMIAVAAADATTVAAAVTTSIMAVATDNDDDMILFNIEHYQLVISFNAKNRFTKLYYHNNEAEENERFKQTTLRKKNKINLLRKGKGEYFQEMVEW